MIWKGLRISYGNWKRIQNREFILTANKVPQRPFTITKGQDLALDRPSRIRYTRRRSHIITHRLRPRIRIQCLIPSRSQIQHPS